MGSCSLGAFASSIDSESSAEFLPEPLADITRNEAAKETWKQ